MTAAPIGSEVDAEWLFKLRVVVARCGEMDLGRWWNSGKQLGAAGASVLFRGFPRTHHFAQARCVTAIAEQRCAQLLGGVPAITLWQLPQPFEAEIERRWDAWLDHTSAWKAFFASVGALSAFDPARALQSLSLVTAYEVKASAGLKRRGEERGIAVASSLASSRRELALLALGFAAGGVNDPVVPYIPGRAA